VTLPLSRAQLFSRGAKGGAALLVAGSVSGLFAGSAAADTLSDADLAYARLLVGTELLAADFYTQAIASKQLSGDPLKYLKRALFNEQEHYTSVSEHLSVLTRLSGGDPIGISFPPPLTIDEASSALDAFTS
jgi:hypothetical protein